MSRFLPMAVSLGVCAACVEPTSAGVATDEYSARIQEGSAYALGALAKPDAVTCLSHLVGFQKLVSQLTLEASDDRSFFIHVHFCPGI
jgi:hypothetical protein